MPADVDLENYVLESAGIVTLDMILTFAGLMFCVGFVVGKVSVWRISLRCKCKSSQAFLIFHHLLVTYICLIHIVVFKSSLPDIAPKRKEHGTEKGFEEKGSSSSDLLEVIVTNGDL